LSGSMTQAPAIFPETKTTLFSLDCGPSDA
jgi:hypothetical protein